MDSAREKRPVLDHLRKSLLLSLPLLEVQLDGWMVDEWIYDQWEDEKMDGQMDRQVDG